MPRIACLHTAESNVAVFDLALQELGLETVELHHVVRPDLLAEAANGLTEEVAIRTGEALRDLYHRADVVLLTCSTLGPVAEAASRTSPVPILRVDGALAQAAAKDGGTVAVLCAVDTSFESTRHLFHEAAVGTGAEIVMHHVPGAWTAFEAGDGGRYLASIAAAADAAAKAGADRVVLAQASMAGAAKLVSGGVVVLTSPALGLAAAAEAAVPRPKSPRPGTDAAPDDNAVDSIEASR